MFRLIEFIKTKWKLRQEEKEFQKEMSLLAYTCQLWGLPIENLTAFESDELQSFISDLAQKVSDKIGKEPDTVSVKDMSGSGLPDYTLPAIFTWEDKIRSLRATTKKVWRVRDLKCPHCGGEHTIVHLYCSSPQSWRERCGSEGYELFCPDCLRILKYKQYKIN